MKELEEQLKIAHKRNAVKDERERERERAYKQLWNNHKKDNFKDKRPAPYNTEYLLI